MFLYRTEAKSIQSWILASGQLGEISGGSEIVDGIATLAHDRARALGAEVVQAAAGGATIRFPDHEGLQEFVRFWPVSVAARASGLSVIQAWVEESGSASTDWTELQNRLGASRNIGYPDLPECGPLVARAGRTGLPAVARGVEAMLDRASRARIDAFRGGRDRLANKLLPPGDLEFLTEVEDFPPGYLAVVHVDANGVGSILANELIPDWQKFSEELSAATEAAAKAAMSVLLPAQANGRVPARPIVLGGDDFTVIVPARYAIAMAQSFLSTFEQETETRRTHVVRKLSACAGIAIVKPGWPFIDAHELAESLCKSAKRVFRGQQLSGVAFYRVTTALSGDWEEVIRDTLTIEGGADERSKSRCLTRNPYSLSDLEKLITLSTAAAALPRGTLREWVTKVQSDIKRGQEHWDRMREVATVLQADRRPLAAFDEALRDLDCDPNTGWTRDLAHTPILDALELRAAVKPRATRSPKSQRNAGVN